MTNSQLPAVTEPANLTAALRKAGALDRGAVREVKVLHQRDTIVSHIVRLGLRYVGGLNEVAGKRIVDARRDGPYRNVEDLTLRANLDTRDLKALAAGDALLSLAGHRRQQVWEASAQVKPPELLRDAPVNEARSNCRRRRRARRSCSTTPRSASRCAATRSRCCGPSSRSASCSMPTS